MFCMKFISSWNPYGSSSTNEPETPRPSNTAAPGYRDIQPMVRYCRDIHDVIEAELSFGISFFSEYRGFSANRRVFFSARFQDEPHRIRTVSCPLSIDAGKLRPEDQILLQIKLDAARDWVPENTWSVFGIVKNEGLIVYNAEKRPIDRQLAAFL
ncbi:hypothetical protein FE257_003373 [Aspergillus nanangensis]|uniref:Uncharacterized protein n=1 Tax=Aspergillus nanangensis TaxID=2582783 RepID=A0AAD4GNM4_ASPNN|nr:hypothetical protein FE257_003373 [Aspergillus nanangensis]